MNLAICGMIAKQQGDTMSQHTTQQLIDMIRRGDRLGHRMMQTIATRLEEVQAENERLKLLQRTLEGVGNGN